MNWKKLLAELVISKIEPISKKMNDYLKNKDYLTKILHIGKEKAVKISSKNLLEVKKIIGLLNIWFIYIIWFIMNIETELTPNPETLKFIVDKNVINQHGIEVTNMNEAKNYKFTKDSA